MTLEEFHVALRKACDAQVETMARVLRDFAAELRKLEDEVKSSSSSAPEIISLVIDAELRRYAAKLDAI